MGENNNHKSPLIEQRIKIGEPHSFITLIAVAVDH